MEALRRQLVDAEEEERQLAVQTREAREAMAAMEAEMGVMRDQARQLREHVMRRTQDSSAMQQLRAQVAILSCCIPLASSSVHVHHICDDLYRIWCDRPKRRPRPRQSYSQRRRRPQWPYSSR